MSGVVNEHVCFAGCRCGGDGVAYVDTRLRYMPGEHRANEMWQEALARLGPGLGMGESDETGRLSLADAVSRECVEIVALGCVVPGRSDLVWVELENSSRQPWHEFVVMDSEMRRAVAYMLETFGEHTRAHVLWHSHYAHPGPSQRDLSTFPEWLVGMGVVHHTPTETSYAYDQSGVVSPLSRTSTLAR